MPTPITLQFLRQHKMGPDLWSVWIDGSGSGYREASGGSLVQVSPWREVFPSYRGACGIGMGAIGTGSLGWGNNGMTYPSGEGYSMGVGIGYLGLGELGFWADYITWRSIRENLNFKDGTFLFEIRLADRLKNIDADGGTEQEELLTSTPRPPKNTAISSATANELNLTWTASPDEE